MSDSANQVITYKPMGITHVLISAIWALSLVAINGIIFYVSRHLDDIQFLYLFFINAGIATPNAYYLSKLDLSPSGSFSLQSSTPKQ